VSSPGGPPQPFPNDPASPQPGGFPPPGAPAQPAAPAAPSGTPQQARPGNRAVRVVVWIVAIVVVLGGIAAVSWYMRQDDAQNAKVGDCLKSDGDDLSIVECGDGDAKFKVAGRVEDKTDVEGISACAAFADQGVTQSYWRGEQGEKGVVLCLAPSE
jgi:hypothetical protein